MNIQSLKYLVALTEHQHFGKAAEACFVSQPTLSMQLKKFEDELGLILIERTNKSVLLTTAGKLIVEHAQTIMSEVQQIKDTASSIKDPYSGSIRLGIIPTLAPYLLPHIMPTLRKNFPHLLYYLVEEKTDILIEKLKAGALDACFLATSTSDINILNETLFEEPFLLAVAKDHALSKQAHVTQEDLNHKSLLLLEDGHCLRDQALEVCQKAQAEEDKTFRGTSLETLRHMVSAGIGMTLIPSLACKKDDGLCYLPFTNPQPSRTIVLSWRKTSARSTLLRDMALSLNILLSQKR